MECTAILYSTYEVARAVTYPVYVVYNIYNQTIVIERPHNLLQSCEFFAVIPRCYGAFR